jgi:F-type H+-transporting ATPase subunit alpha
MLERGRRVREVLKQPQYRLLPVPEQIAVFVAVNSGVLDKVPMNHIAAAERSICDAIESRFPELASHVLAGNKLDEQQIKRIEGVARDACAHLEPTDGND